MALSATLKDLSATSKSRENTGIVVLTLCVCVSVCYHFHGQAHRPKVKVTRSKIVHGDVPLTSESIVMMDLPEKKLRNTMLGVFKSYAFFTNVLLMP